MNITVNIRVNMRDREVLANCRQAGEQAMLDTVVDIAHDAVRDSPKITGNNARSINYQVDGLKGKVFSTSGYGGFLETGTGIYGSGQPIRPVSAKMLAWQDRAGNWIFAKEVSGRRATPYMRPALDRHFTADKFAERMRRHLS